MSTLLPELPEPADHRYKFLDFLGREVWGDGIPYGQKALETQELFTADQVRAIQLEAWKAGVEHAAKVCDEAHPHDWPFLAAAIRSLPYPE